MYNNNTIKLACQPYLIWYFDVFSDPVFSDSWLKVIFLLKIINKHGSTLGRVTFIAQEIVDKWGKSVYNKFKI